MPQYTDYTLCHGHGDATGQKLAIGLGWFSIGLGLLELVATRTLTRWLGMTGNEELVRLYGAREITTGIGILSSKDPTPWIWGRVAGDALDLGTLGAHFTDENSEQENVALALLNVGTVTALDVYCAHCLSRETREAPGRRDYSNRSGLPRAPQAMRGAARDFEVPRDMRAPEPMRPYTNGGS